LAKSRLRWNFQKGVNANLELSAVAGIIIIYIFMDVPNSTEAAFWSTGSGYTKFVER
jgi:hypothetical protein